MLKSQSIFGCEIITSDVVKEEREQRIRTTINIFLLLWPKTCQHNFNEKTSFTQYCCFLNFKLYHIKKSSRQSIVYSCTSCRFYCNITSVTFVAYLDQKHLSTYSRIIITVRWNDLILSHSQHVNTNSILQKIQNTDNKYRCSYEI